MALPYVPLVLGICVVVVFYKIGEHDQEIGTTVGLIVGALVLAANVYLPGGLLRLGLYIVAGLALLTVYKILRSALAARSGDEDTNDD